jgi:hypothetical protein
LKIRTSDCPPRLKTKQEPISVSTSSCAINKWLMGALACREARTCTHTNTARQTHRQRERERGGGERERERERERDTAPTCNCCHSPSMPGELPSIRGRAGAGTVFSRSTSHQRRTIVSRSLPRSSATHKLIMNITITRRQPQETQHPQTDKKEGNASQKQQPDTGAR